MSSAGGRGAPEVEVRCPGSTSGAPEAEEQEAPVAIAMLAEAGREAPQSLLESSARSLRTLRGTKGPQQTSSAT